MDPNTLEQWIAHSEYARGVELTPVQRSRWEAMFAQAAALATPSGTIVARMSEIADAGVAQSKRGRRRGSVANMLGGRGAGEVLGQKCFVVKQRVGTLGVKPSKKLKLIGPSILLHPSSCILHPNSCQFPSTCSSVPQR